MVQNRQYRHAGCIFIFSCSNSTQLNLRIESFNLREELYMKWIISKDKSVFGTVGSF